LIFPSKNVALMDLETLEKVLEFLADNSSIESQGECD
jgi:hypothetical protein